jgi:hypothetical protein
MQKPECDIFVLKPRGKGKFGRLGRWEDGFEMDLREV